MQVTKFKPIVAAVGATITAVSAGWAAVETAAYDGSIGVDEVGSLATTAVTLILTVWGVWRVPYLRPTMEQPTSRPGVPPLSGF